MTIDLKKSSSYWILRHSIVVWVGIVANAFLFLPLFFWPDEVIAFFNVPALDNTTWARACAMLLAIITVFYVPATIDFARYRLFAWLGVFPSRTFGATFFATAVFLFNQAPGFLIVTLLDAVFGLATLVCLMKIHAYEKAEEQAARQGGERS